MILINFVLFSCRQLVPFSSFKQLATEKQKIIVGGSSFDLEDEQLKDDERAQTHQRRLKENFGGKDSQFEHFI